MVTPCEMLPSQHLVPGGSDGESIDSRATHLEDPENVESTFASPPSHDPDGLSFHTSNKSDPPDPFIPENLQLTLDGVDWGGKGQNKRKFPQAFEEALRCVNMTGTQKLAINERFVNVATKYRAGRKRWGVISSVSRVVVTVGSILVPGMVILDDEITERSQASQAIAYVVFGVSLTVSIVNGLQELFSATKRFITLSTTEEMLVTEGWLFIGLSGKYSRFEDHRAGFAYFMNRIEKINSVAVQVTNSLAMRPDEQRARKRSGNGNTSSGSARMNASVPRGIGNLDIATSSDNGKFSDIEIGEARRPPHPMIVFTDH